MTEAAYAPLLDSIMKSLAKHGYPDKRVSLPLDRMYEVAYQKALNFNKALVFLAEQGVDHEKTETKIIFFPKALAAAVPADPFAAFAGLGPEATDAASMGDMLSRAEQLLQAMPPEQRAQIEALYRGMSSEQRADLERQARELGLPK
jgi:hypothetical protein